MLFAYYMNNVYIIVYKKNFGFIIINDVIIVYNRQLTIKWEIVLTIAGYDLTI